MGFVIFVTERTLGAICDGRTSLSPNASPRAFIAYRGTYRFDGAKLVTRADKRVKAGADCAPGPSHTLRKPDAHSGHSRVRFAEPKLAP